MGQKSEVRENRAFEQKENHGACWEETTVLELKGHIMVRYSEWRVLGRENIAFWHVRMRRSAGRCLAGRVRTHHDEGRVLEGAGELTCDD
jgi:hypothetical protein